MHFAVARRKISAAVFKAAGIQRIHIIGCSRSGTTMLHIAMSYFKNVLLSPNETDIEAPYLSERLRMLLQKKPFSGPAAYVTKRNFGWYRPENVERIVEQTRDESIGIIHIVRDPRDVMTSMHAAAKKSGSYVSPEHWRRSMEAGDRILARLGNYPRKLEIRYEDVVTHPDATARHIAGTFGLQPNEDAQSFAMIQNNFESNGAAIHSNLIEAVHKLRQMDASSVGRWKRRDAPMSPVGDESEIAESLNSFLRRYDYDLAV